jgi:hypothetical protein
MFNARRFLPERAAHSLLTLAPPALKPTDNPPDQRREHTEDQHADYYAAADHSAPVLRFDVRCPDDTGPIAEPGTDREAKDQR